MDTSGKIRTYIVLYRTERTEKQEVIIPKFLPFIRVSILTRLIVFCFTLEVFSESRSLGVEHWAKYKPCPSGLQFPGGLGKFDDQFTFTAEQIRPLFTDLVGRFEAS